MGWIARTVLRSLKRAEREIQAEQLNVSGEEKVSGMSQAQPDISNDIEPLRIEVMKATGGNIVRFTKYDRTKETVAPSTYVIPTDEDFAESFTKLVCLEMFKR